MVKLETLKAASALAKRNNGARGIDGGTFAAIETAGVGRVPLAGPRKEWVVQGALFSYADNLRAIGRAAASRYVDRILKGTKPADLPVEEISEFELVINLKTAKAIRLTIPQSVLAAMASASEGSWGGRCPSLADSVRRPKATRGTTAARAG